MTKKTCLIKIELLLMMKDKVISFYENNLKKNVVTFNQFFDDEEIFYRKSDEDIDVEIKKPDGAISIWRIIEKIKKKVQNKQLNSEIWQLYVPNFSISNFDLKITCSNQDKNPYYGKKDELVTICKITPNSATVRFVLGKEKSTNTIILQRNHPHHFLEVIFGKKHYYIDNITIMDLDPIGNDALLTDKKK